MSLTISIVTPGDFASAEACAITRYESMTNLIALLQLVQNKGAISALLSWPKIFGYFV